MYPTGPLIDLLLDEHRERVARAVRRSSAPVRGRAITTPTPAGCLS